ncbi:biotin/lipoyl-containing protein [Virgibacillus halophilus]|uniref:Biotin/lipoyl-containing protein n=1 Tax=Tigheibacillus halophilus TaxID=361280 RepID=A0ABU5C4E4_9BACI|nr:biotin/lipoyl-containing protein [Virgibacillus halophilus]
MAVDRTVYGRMQPKKMTPVTIPAPGKTEELEVSEGDHVKKDDVLFTLSTPAGKQTIKSPEDGVVLQLKAEEDASVSNDDPVAMIADADTMTLELSVTSAVRKHFKKDTAYDILF